MTYVMDIRKKEERVCQWVSGRYRYKISNETDIVVEGINHYTNIALMYVKYDKIYPMRGYTTQWHYLAHLVLLW